MAETLSYRIYPSIGIARLGSNDEGVYFLGPEVPSAVPEGPFRSSGKLKSQGYVFEFTSLG